MAKMPHPKLKGVIQVDETFFREDQKGSKHLVSTVEGIEKLLAMVLLPQNTVLLAMSLLT